MTAWYHQTLPDTPTYRCPRCSAVVESSTDHERWHESLEADDVTFDDLRDKSLPTGKELHDLTARVLARPPHLTLIPPERVYVDFNGLGAFEEGDLLHTSAPGLRTLQRVIAYDADGNTCSGVVVGVPASGHSLSLVKVDLDTWTDGDAA